MTAQPAADNVQFDRSGRHLTVYVSGELDALLAPVVAERVLAHHQPGDEEVWLDLSDVTACDSSGLRAIFLLNQALDGHGSRFILYDLAPAVQKALEMVDQRPTLKIRTGDRWPT